MSGEDKIYADASQPATLIDGGESIDCPTLGEAVVALDSLPEPRKNAATIRSRIGSSPLPRLIGCITARPDPLERARVVRFSHQIRPQGRISECASRWQAQMARAHHAHMLRHAAGYALAARGVDTRTLASGILRVVDGEETLGWIEIIVAAGLFGLEDVFLVQPARTQIVPN